MHPAAEHAASHHLQASASAASAARTSVQAALKAATSASTTSLAAAAAPQGMQGMHHHQMGEESSAPPMAMMAMSFSSSCDVVLLFDWWHPRTQGAYVLSLCVIFALCLLQEWLVASRALMTQPPPAHGSGSGEDAPLFKAWRPSPRRTAAMERTLLTANYAASVALGFAIMLLVMSFNWGVFLTVIAGLATGHALFMPRRVAGSADNPALCH